MPDFIPLLTSNAKPFGVIGCGLWMKISGTLPVDLSECEFVALDTRTPRTVEGVHHGSIRKGSDANKTVHYIGRCQNSCGEKGLLPAPPDKVRETKSGSETVSATVPE